MKVSIDRRTAIASTFAASAIAVSPRLFALDDADIAEVSRNQKFAHVLSDPTERQFVGRWRISEETESFEILLEPNGKFTMKCFSVPSVDAGKGEFKWGGKGDWVVRDNSFLLHKTHKWMWVGWGEDAHTIYNWHSVVDVTPDAIILTSNVELKRL